MTSKQFLRVFRKISSDHNASVVQIDIALQASQGKEYMLSKQSLFNRFRNKMENLEEKNKIIRALSSGGSKSKTNLRIL